MHIWSKFYISRPLFAQDLLDCLQGIMASKLPQWSGALSVAENDDSPPVAVSAAASLYDCLSKMMSSKSRLGSAVVTGDYDRLAFYLNYVDGAFPPELNRLAVELYNLEPMEGEDPVVRIKDLFKAISGQMPIRYANARDDEEFRAKNMIDDETGVEAIGVDITEAIPGLYWLNYFGAPYVELIGRERLLTAPAFEVRALGEGVMLAMDQSPNNWQPSAYHDREQAVIAHLGQQYFFSRWDPDRKTIARDFQ